MRARPLPIPLPLPSPTSTSPSSSSAPPPAPTPDNNSNASNFPCISLPKEFTWGKWAVEETHCTLPAPECTYS